MAYNLSSYRRLARLKRYFIYPRLEVDFHKNAIRAIFEYTERERKRDIYTYTYRRIKRKTRGVVVHDKKNARYININI